MDRPYGIYENPLLYPSYLHLACRGEPALWDGPNRDVFVADSENGAMATGAADDVDVITRYDDPPTQAEFILQRAQALDTDEGYNIAIEAMVAGLQSSRKPPTTPPAEQAKTDSERRRLDPDLIRENLETLRERRREIRDNPLVARNGVSFDSVREFENHLVGIPGVSVDSDQLHATFGDKQDSGWVRNYLDWAGIDRMLDTADEGPHEDPPDDADIWLPEVDGAGYYL